MNRRLLFPALTALVSRLIVMVLVAMPFAAAQAQTTQPDAGVGSQIIAQHSVVMERLTGIVCLPKVNSPELAIQNAKESGAIVYALNPDPQKVIEFRRAAAREGLLGKTVYFDVGTPDQIPLADNYADRVILTDVTNADLASLSMEEIRRVLVPGGKVVLIGKKLDWDEKLHNKIFTQSVLCIVMADKDRLEAEKSYLPGAADWGMWYCGADNNAMSADTVLKTPYQTQFIETPIYAAAPSLTLAAGGRVFVYSGPHAPADVAETANTLYARNGYNGINLWKYRYQGTKEQANNPGDVIAATPQWVLLAEGSRVCGLDAATGQQRITIELPCLTTDIKSIRVEGNLAYLLDSSPDGTTVAVCELPDLARDKSRSPLKNPKWTTKEDADISPRMLGIRDGRVVYCTSKGIAKCLDAKTGKLLWQKEAKEFVQKMDTGKLSAKDFHQALGSLGMSAGVVLTPKLAFFRSPLKKELLALALADGKLVNTLPVGLDYSNASVFYDAVRDKVYAALPAEGEGKKNKSRAVTLDPETAQIASEDCPLAMSAGQCERMTANEEQSLQHGGTWGASYSRTACNNGKVTANGELYIASTAHCRCIQTISGLIGLSSAGSENAARPKFDEKIHKKTAVIQDVAVSHISGFPVDKKDWKEYRANPQHSASVPVTIGQSVKKMWGTPPGALASAAASFNGRLLIGREDGQIQCLFVKDGDTYWNCPTGGPVTLPPTISADGMDVIAGSMDGYLYILNSADGRIFGQFCPKFDQERKINLYGHLCSSRPIITGVATGKDGTIYAAAGMLNIDGTCIYALKDGKVLWQNADTSLSGDHGEGISLLGHLALAGDKLLIPARSQPAPAAFDTKTGKLLLPSKPSTAPFYPTGREVMVWNDKWVIYGGRPLFSPLTPVVRSGFSFGRPTTFSFYKLSDAERTLDVEPFGITAVPPAWDDNLFVAATYMDGELCAWEPKVLDAWLEDIQQGKDQKFEKSATFGGPEHQVMRLKDNDFRRAMKPAGLKWGPITGAVASLALAADAVVAVMTGVNDWQPKAEDDAGPASRPTDKWFLRGLDRDTGKTLWEVPLSGTPTPEAICIDRDGRIILGFTDGRVEAYGAK